MPLPSEISQSSHASGLNTFQANRLVVTFHYIDRLLVDIENTLDPQASSAAFPRYAPDISSAERAQMHKNIAEMCGAMRNVLESLQIPDEAASIPASRAVHAFLDAMDIAVQELRPRYMRGYGVVEHKAATNLEGIVGKFSNLVVEMNRCLSRPPRQQ